MNVALIGYGYWGPNIAKNLQASGKTTLYAICDANAAMLDRARKRSLRWTTCSWNAKAT